MCKGKRPIGATKGKQTNTMASCQPPPPSDDELTGTKFSRPFLANLDHFWPLTKNIFLNPTTPGGATPRFWTPTTPPTNCRPEAPWGGGGGA